MQIKKRNLHPSLTQYIEEVGSGPGLGDTFYLVTNKTTDVPYLKLKEKGISEDFIKSTFATGEAALTSLQQDTLIVEPGSHSLAAALAIDGNCNRFIGTAPGKFNIRSRIGMSTAFTPMITVSGYGNYFQNLYTMHGTAAGDYIGWLVSGARNEFNNVHFGGPMIAAQGGHASYVGVHVTGSENYFHDCVFGTNTIERDEITPNVKLGPGTITVFDNCIFTCALTDTDPIFVYVDNSASYTQAFFRNCMFLAFSSNHANAMAVAFVFSGGYSADICFDKLCSFSNVTKLAASASMKYLWLPTNFDAATDELNLISTNSATY
jgi:hypothetical protein